MVGYARYNIHFRKSCAHFKIFHSIEILYCKLSPARVHECVHVCVCVYFKIQKIFNCIKWQNHLVCMEMPMIICQELAIIEKSCNSYDFHDHVGYTCKCQWWPLLFKVVFSNIKNFLASLAILSLIGYNQRFPRIIDVASVIIFWLGCDECKGNVTLQRYIAV